jgi:hypothetical protein
MTLSKIPEPGSRERWWRGLAAAGHTFAVIMGTAGLGLVGGLAYGAWVASHPPATVPNDELVSLIAWPLCLLLYGAIGFVGGLAAGLLIMVLTWIVRLAKRIVRSWEERRGTPA